MFAIAGALAAALVMSGSVDSFDRPAMDRAVDTAAASGMAGVVLVGDQDNTLYARAVSAPGHPHNLDEVWRWASVTKQLTATLVMQQVEAGRLALDETLGAVSSFRAMVSPPPSTVTKTRSGAIPRRVSKARENIALSCANTTFGFTVS